MKTEDYLRFRKAEKNSQREQWKPRNLHEALAHVVEELGEASQMAGKMMRFGYMNRWEGNQNIDRFLEEMEDVVRSYEEFKTWWKDYRQSKFAVDK